MTLRIGSYDNFYSGLYEENVSEPTGNAENNAAQQTVTPKKLPAIPREIPFTAVNCNTERELAFAAYMAAAARAGIASPAAQRAFAERMLAGRTPNLTRNDVPIDDRQVRQEMKGKQYTYVLNNWEISALRQFREDYAAGGGKIRVTRHPVITNPNRQTTGATPVDNPLEPQPSPTIKVRVVLDNSKPVTADRALLGYIQNKYGGGNLWGDNIQNIFNAAKSEGVAARNLTVTPMGNRRVAEFELLRSDAAKIEEIYRLEQEYVNRAEAIFRNIRDNNELASFLRGIVKGAWGAIVSNFNLVAHPLKTLQAIGQIITNPLETLEALKQQLGETWEEFKNADPSRKSEMIGELIGQAAIEILIGKGAGKALSILSKTKAGLEVIDQFKNLKGATAAKIAETFSDEAAEIAAQQARQRLQQLGSQLNSGLPIDAELLARLTVVAGNKIKNGAVKFAEFAKEMISEVGEQIKPHLEQLYREAMTKLGLADKIDETGIRNALTPTLDGKVNYQVHDPNVVGRTIVDIDRFEGKILWEEKSATSGVNKITGVDETAKWISKHITKKFEDLVEARKYLPDYYKDAEIGFDFVRPGADPKFKAAVEAEIDRLSKLHPDIKIRVNWR